MFEQLVPPALASAALAHLQHDGVRRGAIVAWLGHNSWDMLATLVACERLGAVLLPLNWRLVAGELAAIVEHAGAGHLMGTPEVEGLAVEVLARARLAPGPARGVEEGDLLLVYTSGTTGRPRGAMHTAAGLRANAMAAIAGQQLGPGSRVLSVLPLFHAGGLNIQTLPALAAGGKVLLHPRFDAAAWFDAVEEWRPTTSLLVPATLRALIEHPRWAGADLSSLKFVCTGSQVVPRGLIDAFHNRVMPVPVAQVYGATETGPVSVVLSPDEALANPGMAGRAALGVQLKLKADGEILVKGPNLMRCYHRSTESGFDADGWFHTGDLARLHAGGLIEVVGRSQELIISGGENVHPAEIENLIMGCRGVADCAVVGEPDPRWGEVPVLAVVPAADAVIDAAALLASLEGRLARFKHPRRVVVLDALPKTALGKVRRDVLARQLRSPGLD